MNLDKSIQAIAKPALVALAALILGHFQARAATVTASGTVNWSSLTGGSGTAGQPNSSDTVSVSSGATLTVNTTATCGALTFAAPASGANSTVTISGSNTLTVTTAITMNRPATGGLAATLNVGSGSVSCGSLIMSATTSTGTRKNVITLSTGTLTCSGAVTCGTTGCEITVSGMGTLNLGYVGTVFTSKPTFTPGTGTVNYNGNGNQTIGALAYNNMAFSGSGAKSMAVGTLVTGNLSIAPAATANVGASLNLGVGTLMLGGAGQVNGTWGGTGSGATNINAGYFAATTGYLTVSANSTPAAKDFLTFGTNVAGSTAAINTTAGTVTWTVPYGTGVTTLAPTYTVSAGASGMPVSGTTRNFTTPQSYTLTAQDLSTRSYTVTVTVAAAVPTVTTLNVTAAGTGLEILNTCTLVAANHFGGPDTTWGASSPVTLNNGLTFGTSAAGMTDNWATTGSWTPMHSTATDQQGKVGSLTDANFGALMRSYIWIAYGSSVSWLDIPNLTAGHTYRLQLISPDPEGSSVTVEGGTPVAWAGTIPSLLTYYWTAADTTANVVLTRTGGEIEFTGYALHDITVTGPSSAKDMLTFSFPSLGAATIGGTNISLTVPNGTAVTALAPTCTVSPLATCSPVSGTVRNFTTPQTYTVTAEDNSTQTYTVTVTTAPASTAKDMLTFGPGATITGTTIAWNVPYGTDVTTLAPALTVSPLASCAPASGATRNFTTPQTYTVTAQDNSTQVYTVTVTVAAPSSAKSMLTFGPGAAINGSNITWTVPFGSSLTNLAPSYTVSPLATCSPASGTVRNFTTPQTYTVTAQDNSTQAYTVTVTVLPDAPTAINVNIAGGSNPGNAWMNGIYSGDANARGSASRVAPASYGGNVWNDFNTSGANSSNLLDSTGAASGVGLATTMQAGPWNDWTGLGTARMLVSGFISSYTSYTNIIALTGLKTNHTYDLHIASLHNTSNGQTSSFRVGAVVKTVNYSAVTDWTDGKTHARFTGLVPATGGTLTVEAMSTGELVMNGLQLVDTTPMNDITRFTFPIYGDATISGTNITMTVPYGTNVGALAPTYSVSYAANGLPASGATRDFTTPQTYTITASDNSTKTYTVTVTVRPIADPEFTLTAPASWDGRQTITVASNITNAALLQATGGTNVTYTWSAAGVAVIKTTATGTMTLTRAQGNGPLTVTLVMSNGGWPITHSVTINVQQPASDAWVQRTPAADDKPVDGQFFARDDTGYGRIYYNGTQSGSPTSVFLKVYRTDTGTDVLYASYSQALVGGTYAFTAPVLGGLYKYRVVYGTTTNGTDTTLATVSNLICGDAYLLNGQSNTVAETPNNGTPPEANYYSSDWIRSYGNSNDGTVTGGWGTALRTRTWGSAGYGMYQIGAWGIDLAKQLLELHNMPICIINGAVGGTRIDQHQRNETNHEDSSTIYGRLLTRVEAAKLTHGIRGVLWHQGEQDQGHEGPFGGDYDYKYYQQNFVNMSAAWKQDYPNIRNYYIYQIWPAACGDTSANDMLRETQRTLPSLYSNMRVMSTIGVEPGSGCHFDLDGYQMIAELMRPQVEQDNYGRVPDATETFTAPNLKSAWFTTAANNEIALEFDQDMYWTNDALGLFFLDSVGGKVTSGSVSGKVIKLQLAAASTAKAISYVQGLNWDGLQTHLLRSAKGIEITGIDINGNNGTKRTVALAALTFANVPIASYQAPVDQTINFGPLPAKVVGDAPFTLTATASSGLAVSYVSSNPAVAGVSGSTVTIVSAGSTTITASQAGNAGYNAATPVAQTLTVSAAGTATTTTLSTSGSPSTYGATVTLTATLAPAPPGGTVQFYDNAVALGSPVSVSGSQAQHITGALTVGSHSITATYSGTIGFGGSTSGVLTQAVSKATPTITTAPTASEITYGQTLASSSLSGGAGSVAGGFAFTAPATAPNAGTASQAVTFTPTDTTNYNPLATTVSVVVTKATPAYKAPAGGAGTMVTVVMDARHPATINSPLSGPAGSTTHWNIPNPPLTDNGQDANGTNLVDTAGVATTVGFKFHMPGNDPWGSPTLQMLATGLFNSGWSDWGQCEITGLTADNTYTLFIASARINDNERSKGTFRTTNTADNQTADVDCSSGYGSNSGGPRNGDTWVEGNNYVVFRNVVADTNGKILFTANENCAPHLVINGFQLVAAGSPTPPATPLTYGQALSASTLGGSFTGIGGTTLPGTMAFTYPDTVPAVGTAPQEVTFIPADTANYITATTSVNVTVNPPPDPFVAWIGTNYPALSGAAAEPGADPDRDGLTNQQEFAFGLDPTKGSSCSPITAPLDNTAGTFSYTRHTGTGLAYTVWTSTDMLAWTKDPGADQHVDGTRADVETVTVTLSGAKPLTAPKVFIRVNAE